MYYKEKELNVFVVNMKTWYIKKMHENMTHLPFVLNCDGKMVRSSKKSPVILFHGLLNLLTHSLGSEIR